MKQQSRWGRRPEDPDAEKLTTRATLEPSLASTHVAHVQTRNFRAAAVAVRGASQDARTVRGLALPYGEVIQVGDGAEMFKYGCFRDSLIADDPRVFFNSNIDQVIGRAAAGTAQFEERRDGLHFQATLPACQWAADLAVSMDRGDVDGTSCNFVILESERQQINGETVNVVTKAKLIAASVSTFSMFRDANQATSELLAQAKAAGFRLGLEQGKKDGAAKRGAMGVSPTNRVHAEYQRRINSVR